MIQFFTLKNHIFYLIEVATKLANTDIEKLKWLFSGAEYIEVERIKGTFIGPRQGIITPWGTNVVEITQNMGIKGIIRVEQFYKIVSPEEYFDPMLQQIYNNLTNDTFTIDIKPSPVKYVDNIEEYNKQEGLALSKDEIKYLHTISKKINRRFTDSEVFGFSQVNSEHCRHKIFNGTFIIDGKEQAQTLFQLIKATAQKNPNKIVSAYKDNVAFVGGPTIKQFAPHSNIKADYFKEKNIHSVLSLKAETHNFPTTVEPFNGAATGSGGEIRDRLAGGKGSIPMAGTAVYMTSYTRMNNQPWEKNIKARKWLYHTPQEILTKSSNGASDFGNKFGQPLICGSIFTFEHIENNKRYGYDKVIMLAGGIGYAKKEHALKDTPQSNEKIVVLGGDNYRIGMGGGAVSSVATGEYNNKIELNAVQRSNPEMQKRAANVIRALTEEENNPITSIHDHGAGGHLNCLSELVEETGGNINLNKLPIGDPTLSAKEIIGNESQERMGFIVKEKNIEKINKIACRERSPMYLVGETLDDKKLIFKNSEDICPIDLHLDDLLGTPPKTIMTDETVQEKFEDITYTNKNINIYIEQVLQLETVACKDWLTNKVDRSVTGKVALQQTTGKIQLPLNNLGIVALDYEGKKGIATSIGHSPISALISPEAGSKLSVAESLTNIIWAPIEDSLKGISLSANWMWPCKNKGEDQRLYKAVEAISQFVIDLGINIPTGKDSLSMTQKYKNEDPVYAPGTVIISAVGEVTDIKKTVTPTIKNTPDTTLIYIDFSKSNFELGGSSFAQIHNKIGKKIPNVEDPNYFVNTFNTIQKLINKQLILAGHDVSAGGLITTLLEMTFADDEIGLSIDLNSLKEEDIIKILFSEKPSIVIQVKELNQINTILNNNNIDFAIIGHIGTQQTMQISHKNTSLCLDINKLKDTWFQSSYLFDDKQTANNLARERYYNYKKQKLKFSFSNTFKGSLTQYELPINAIQRTKNIKAAIIREKGANGDREMAYSMYLAGFNVKDIHMTDLISGKETLENIHFIVFVGGFSNSDVLGAAKGWAGAFIYNEKANQTLKKFYNRKNTASLGVCNGCQLMVELNLIDPHKNLKIKMEDNDSGKFESAFINMNIPENNSIMFKSLSGNRLGIWIAHGQGKFHLHNDKQEYNIVGKYSYDQYPANPNGSHYSTAAICSTDGRHLAMMPHLERSIFPWQWAYYPGKRKNDQITPWIEAFINARKWLEKNK